MSRIKAEKNLDFVIEESDSRRVISVKVTKNEKIIESEE